MLQYTDSYGRVVRLCKNMHLNERKFVHVLPEVVELINRLQKRLNTTVNVENISYELRVSPEIVGNVFSYLGRIGLLCKQENNKCKILREVEESDYGKAIKKSK